MAILALFAASLQFFMGNGGLVSFGHAAFFGLGAYAAALLVKDSAARLPPRWWPRRSPPALAALAAGFFVLRAQGVYASMLTLAFAQILWSIAVQWVEVTGGDNGLLGVWPPTTSRLAYYLITLGGRRSCAARCCGVRRWRRSALRCGRRAMRPSARRRWASTCAGCAGRRSSRAALFGGLAGALQAFQKGAVFPERAVDPAVGRCAGHGAAGRAADALRPDRRRDRLPRTGDRTDRAMLDYWRLLLGVAIVVLVIAFPQGIVGFAARTRGEAPMSELRVSLGVALHSAACRPSTMSRSCSKRAPSRR